MTDTILDEFNETERVARGVAWLDEIRPDWRDRVTLPELRLTSACNCVLGQVFDEPGYPEPGFNIAIDRYLTLTEAQNFGFDVDSRYAGTTREREWGALQAEWERVLSQ